MNDFLKHLINYTLSSNKIKRKELWDVKGILKNKSNEEFKFDLTPISKLNNNDFGKKGYFKSKANKIVFDTKDKWIIVDKEELDNFIKKNKQKIIYLDFILDNFEWNIIIKKLN